MNKKQHSGVFMMEMIMVVFFFIICASICILVFVRADKMSRRADDLNQAVLAAQSAAEVWKAEGEDGLEKRFQAVSDGSGSLTMYFEKNGSAASPDAYVCQVTVTPEPADSDSPVLRQADIAVTCGGESVFSLSVSRHVDEK